MNILTQAKSLLQIHEGSCSVLSDSSFGKAFALMQAGGEVEITNCSTQGYINVRSIHFKPRFLKRTK